MYSNESFKLTSGNGPPNHLHLPPPPPLPPPVQQAYMYPPPPTYSASQAQLSTMPGTTPSYTNLSYSNPEVQSTITSPQQFHHHLPHVSMLPPPPPLPPRTMPLSQSFPYQLHPQPIGQLSLPLSSLEPLPLPPPPPLSSPNVCETVSLTAIEETRASKEPSLQLDKAEEHGSSSLICTDPDIEMEDDITLPEDENETKSYAIHKDIENGSRQASSSPYSGRAKIVPECGLSDMYDPFVDSFEPTFVILDCVEEHDPKASISSNTPLDKEENNQDVDKQALTESDKTARVSVSSNKPPDVEENNTADEIRAIVSKENDEFGENVDNESHETETPNEDPKVSECDRDMRESGDEPKEKDSSSRSMKPFKVVLTKFVKDLLKPSWMQGNMSKEAFKTIVKRVVEKVSKSMKGRAPKSKAKIDKYIDSSQHKLTKLVMGYVDKYVH